MGYIQSLLSRASANYCFYSKGWILFYLLQSDSLKQNIRNINSSFLDVGSSKFNLLRETFLSRSDHSGYCNIDEATAAISNIAAINAYNYLWSREGGNVFLLADDNVPKGPVGQFEERLQDELRKNRSLSRSIKSALKYGLDYGVGYIFDFGGKYHSPHPLRVFDHGGVFIMERYCYEDDEEGEQSLRLFVSGKVSKISSKFDYKFTSRKEYVLFKLVDNNGEYSPEDVVYSEHPFLHKFSPMIYEAEEGVPIGCGIAAVSAALNLQRVSNDTIFAQTSELRPPLLMRQDLVGNDSSVNLSPGSIIKFNQYNATGGEPVRTILPARGVASTGYLDYWISRVRQYYFPENLVGSGVGQTTATEAAQIANTSSAFLSSIRSSFHEWFLTPLIEGFIGKMSKNSSEKFIANNSKIRYIGYHTADVVNNDLQYIQIVQKTMEALKADTPTVQLMYDGVALARRVLRDNIPSDAILSEEEVQEAFTARVARTMQQEQEGQGNVS